MIHVETGDWMAAPAPADRPIYAVGDVHGMAAHLAALHDALEVLIGAEAEGTRPLVVHLGDALDRGPDGMRALRMELDWSHPGADAAMVPGNHEQLLLAALDEEDDDHGRAISLWHQNGGSSVLTEIDCEAHTADGIRAAVRAALGEGRLARLRGLPAAVAEGRWLFVHAGVPEGVSPEDVPAMEWRGLPEPGEAEASPLWVRDAFLDRTDPRPRPWAVLHGHTPTRGGPDVRVHRVNIDTGAFKTRRLTMAELRGAAMRFHTAVG